MNSLRLCVLVVFEKCMKVLAVKFQVFKIIVMQMIYSIQIGFFGFACLARNRNLWKGEGFPNIYYFMPKM
jgi:hypothetical protein